MSPQKWQRIQEIFFLVVNRDDAERSRLLDQHCGTDTELRSEVERLLKYGPSSEEFLNKSPLQLAVAHENDPLTGSRIGNYLIRNRIASGGMGTVYLAHRDDENINHPVAIKVIKRGMDSEDILRRFRLERRALAALNHHGIARFLDVGTAPDGRPFLVMDYVQGIPIDLYCDQRRLCIPERLKLFREVCAAISYAHKNLIVHRDLKPANILIREDGVPKLVDFGLAKVISETGATHTTVAHERRLTPEYASPEQLTGESLNTATDIYSLGVILFELLTGRRPYQFATRNVAEMERVIRHARPLNPSDAVVGGGTDLTPQDALSDSVSPEAIALVRATTPERLRRSLRGDLDTIVLKAMNRDASRRYDSVDQLAEDLERHLNGLPVIARPDTALYRVGKFVRRHALAVSAGVLIAILSAGGVAAIAWQSKAVRKERDAAYLARDQAEAAVDFFQGMLTAVDIEHDDRNTAIRTVVDSAARRIESDLHNQPLLQAAVRSTIGRSYITLGLYDEAERHILAAHRIREERLPSGHHDLAESHFDMAQLASARGQYDEAERLLRSSLKTHQELRGKENIDTARVWNSLGIVLRAAGKHEEARVALERAAEIRRRLNADG